MLQTLRRGHAAMGTWFEVVLRGDAVEHLDDVASMAFEEIDRIERLLSRFDPRSEVSRINRDAATRPLRIDEELFEVLSMCRSAWESTDGYFDVTASPTTHAKTSSSPSLRVAGVGTPPPEADSVADGRSHRGRSTDPGHPERPYKSSETRATPRSALLPSFACVELDADRTIQFTRPDLALDLGGIGKGYALDRAVDILDAFGISSALLHGGTSSVLALGDDGRGQGWKVGVRDPFLPPDVAPELFAIHLLDRGFSCSAVFGHNQGVSDLIDPHQGRPLSKPAACIALAGSGARAEVYSTALLAMGRAKARSQSARLDEAGVSAAWIAMGEDRPVWEWINGVAT